MALLVLVLGVEDFFLDFFLGGGGYVLGFAVSLGFAAGFGIAIGLVFIFFGIVTIALIVFLLPRHAFVWSRKVFFVASWVLWRFHAFCLVASLLASFAPLLMKFPC